MAAARAFFKELGRKWLSLDVAGRARVVLGVVIAIFLVVLLFARKPWSIDWAAIERPAVRDYVTVYSWWAGVFVTAGLAVMAWLARWWARPLSPAVAQSPPPATPRWFVPLVVAAMVVTAVLGAQRLGHSLWDDEEFSARRFIAGSYVDDNKGGARWRPVRWEWTFSNYESPNNHILHSALSKLAHETWTLFNRNAPVPFSEPVLRFPAFIFGILSLASLAWLLKEWGLPRAGVLAAWFCALHPWHLRYASEARGYSLVLFLLPLLLIFWMRALKDGRWRWWIGFGLCQFALLAAYPVMLYTLVVLNLLTVVLLVARHPSGLPPTVPLSRWFATNTFAALACIQIYAPCIPQFQKYLETPVATGAMGMWWARNFFSQLFGGMAWDKSKDPTAPQPELFTQAMEHPVLFPSVVFAALGLAALGLPRIALRGWLPAAGAVVLLLPAWIAYAVAARANNFLFEWYLVFVLPGVLALVAAGWDALFAAASRVGRPAAAVVAAACALWLAGYWQLTREGRDWLLNQPLQHSRESALISRPAIEPNHEGFENILTASFSAPAYLYDPHLHRVRSAGDLRDLMNRAEKEKVPLFLNISNPWAASFGSAELFEIMMESGRFETVAYFHGYDPTLDRIVARYVPGSGAQP